MPEFGILGSSNGLLCLINALFSESIAMYNPFTRDYFDLPKNQDSCHQIVVHGFGRSKQGSEVKVYSRLNNMWLDKGAISYRLEQWSSPGVLVGRNLHWMSVWGQYDDGGHHRVIISCDLTDESFLAIKAPWFGPGSGSDSSEKWVSCSLAVLNGCLCASVPVPSGCGSFDIWMMKEYGVEESWVKEYTVGVYYPVSMYSCEMERSPWIWRKMFGKKMVKVLCVLEGGEVVLEYRRGGLVAYDPWKQSFKELVYEGMPRVFQAIAHVGSLVSTSSETLIDPTFESVVSSDK